MEAQRCASEGMRKTIQSLKVHRHCLILISFLSFLVPGAAYAGDLQSGPITFEISSLPGVERHIHLLKYPSYLCVALLNSGIRFPHSNDLILIDKHSLKVGFLVIRFIGQNGQRYIYAAEILKGIDKRFNLRMEIDPSEVKSGKIFLHIYTPLTKTIKKSNIDRISAKLKRLSEKASQKKLLSYLNGLEDRQIKGTSINEDQLLEMILLDGYNNKSLGSSRKIPYLSNISLLLTLTIIVLITVILFTRKRGK